MLAALKDYPLLFSGVLVFFKPLAYMSIIIFWSDISISNIFEKMRRSSSGGEGDSEGEKRMKRRLGGRWGGGKMIEYKRRRWWCGANYFKNKLLSVVGLFVHFLYCFGFRFLDFLCTARYSMCRGQPQAPHEIFILALRRHEGSYMES